MPALSTAHTHAPAANTAAVVTLAAVSGSDHSIRQIEWSYSATPTAGSTLTVHSGATVYKTFYVSNAGPGFIDFPGGLDAAANTALSVTLAAGGGGVLGAVNVTLAG